MIEIDLNPHNGILERLYALVYYKRKEDNNMRRQGHYITDRRLLFKKGMQAKLLVEIKNEYDLTWSRLAEVLGVSEYTVKVDWKREESTLPLCTAKKLLTLYPLFSFKEVSKNWIEKILEPRWGQRERHQVKRVLIPRHSEKLAEFIGIVLGDGHISKKEVDTTNEFPNEKVYTDYVKYLVFHLFGIHPVLIHYPSYESVTHLRIRSVLIVQQLNRMGMKCGKKKAKTTIPKWIFSNERYVRACLRGLVDTDGGLFHKQKGYRRAIIEFETKSEVVSRDIKKSLKLLGFRASRSNLNVRIQHQNEIIRFFKQIGSSNPKNIIRFQRFIKHGIVPSPKEIKTLIWDFPLNKIPYTYTRS